MQAFHSKTPLIGLLGTIVLCLILSETINLPSHSRLWRELQNALHIPFFGLLAVVLWMILAKARLKLRTLAPPYAHYLVAFSLAVLLGALVEFRQVFIQRDASWLDLLYDALGAALFLSVHALYGPNSLGQRSDRLVKVIMALGVTGLLMVLLPLMMLFGSTIYRIHSFPQINGFDSVWESAYLGEMNADLSFVAGQPQWKSHKDKELLQLQFKAARFSGFWVEDPYADWRGFNTLKIELYSEYEQAFVLVVRVHDSKHNYYYSDRFNHAITILPGENKIRIPLAAIQSAPKNRMMQMDAIASIAIFTSDPNMVGRLVWIDEIVLE